MGGDLSILIAEDNRDLADCQALFLRAAGHHVVVAYDGPGALAATLDGVPDVVLLDIGLPGMDGYEVAERIRRDGRTEDVAIIAVSAYDPAMDESRDPRPAFDLRMVKPVTTGQLLAALRARAPRG